MNYKSLYLQILQNPQEPAYQPDKQPNGSYIVLAIYEQGMPKISSFSVRTQTIIDELESVLRDLNVRSAISERSTNNVRADDSLLEPVRQWGEKLFQLVIRDDIRTLYRDAVRYARQHREHLRLCLQVIPPELASLSWELLYDNIHDIRICQTSDPSINLLRLSRDLQTETDQPISHLPLRILGVVADPKDLQAETDFEREKQAINQAAEEMRRKKAIHLDWRDGITPIEQTLQMGNKNAPWHVFHFIGHGRFHRGQGQLAFVNQNGNAEYISAQTLRNNLHRETQLVFLNGCETARANGFERPSSLTYSLVNQGIPASIGMQFRISDDAAREFAREFYTQVVNGSSVDEAVAEARRRIPPFDRYSPLGWAAPILYANSQKPLYLVTPHQEEISRRVVPLLLAFLALLLVVAMSIGGWAWYDSTHQGGQATPKLVPRTTPPSASNACNAATTLSASAGTTPSSQGTIPFSTENGMHIQIGSDGEAIGLSSGSIFFDTTSPACSWMQKAAEARQQGDMAGFATDLGYVIDADPANAEAKIYEKNYQVFNSDRTYIAIIVGGAFVKENIGGMRDILQGAYVSQMEYNAKATQNGWPSLVLLIANAGSSETGARTVAQQILDLEKVNKTIIGVVGWPFSAYTVNANFVLSKDLVMVSPTASSTSLEGSHYFFRVVSSDSSQALVAAKYAYNTLQARKVLMIYQASDNYNFSLESAFQTSFEQVSNDPKSVISLSYTSVNDLSAKLQANLKKVDMIYFAGYVGDAAHILDILEQDHMPDTFHVMGGDGLAVLNNYSANQTGLNRLVFTAFAAEEEWPSSSALPPFFQEYQHDLVPSMMPPTLLNGLVNLDSDVMQNYDATQLLLAGYHKAVTKTSANCPLACAIANALSTMHGKQAFQGISGQISFQSGSIDPVNKEIVVVSIAPKGKVGLQIHEYAHITPGGTLQVDDAQDEGCFLTTAKCS